MRCDPDKLKQLREKLGITQEKLAADSRAGLRTIQRAEGGQSIRSETAAFIADALAVPLNELRSEDMGGAVDHDGRDNVITLRRVRSGKTLVEILHRSYMCRLDCDIDADGSNVRALKAFAELIEARIPDPLSWTGEHLFGSLAERLDVVASLNDHLRDLEAHGIGVFAGSYSEEVQKPSVSPYEPPEVKAGTRPTAATLTRLTISAGDREKLVVQKDYRWPVAIWEDDLPDWDIDLSDDVPF